MDKRQGSALQLSLWISQSTPELVKDTKQLIRFSSGGQEEAKGGGAACLYICVCACELTGSYLWDKRGKNNSLHIQENDIVGFNHPQANVTLRSSCMHDIRGLAWCQKNLWFVDSR